MKNNYNSKKWRSLSPFRFIVCFIMLLCSTTTLFAQNETKITINVNNVSIKEVLDVVRKHNYRLVYTSADVDGYTNKVTLKLSNATVSQVLDGAFKGTLLTYKIEGNLITIRKANKAERFTASGFVRDEYGKSLEAVTVIVKGTTNGTTTDKNGRFELSVIKGNTLQFTYIGMIPRDVAVESSEPLKVALKEAVNTVDNLVITGYQRIDKRESTSSIVSLKGEDIMEPVGISLDNMLQGKVPGMAVMQQSSTINAAPKIRIRGTSTLIGNREPVWVLDGVVLTDPVKLDATELNSMDRVNLIGNAISGLNPEDIDRIDVLKDASATALYGTKAANGVIVVTTKRGKMGATSVRYSTSMNFVARPTYEKMFRMNSDERIDVSEEIHQRGLEFSGFTPKNVGYEGALQQLWANDISTSQFYAKVKGLREQNTDWFKLLFRNSFSHSHTVSASGATDKVNYYFSAGYANQQGASLNESGDRFSFMSNMGFRVTRNFNISVQLAANVSTTDRPVIDLFDYAYNTSRAIPAYNADGSHAFYDASIISASPIPVPLVYNVFNELENSGSTQKTNNINTNVNLNYKLTSWLSADAILSYNTSATRSTSYNGEKTYEASKYRKLPYGYDLNSLTPAQLKQYREQLCELPFGGILESSDDSNDSYFVRASLNANKLFNEKHGVSFGAGFEAATIDSYGYRRTDYGYLEERGKKFANLTNLSDYPYASGAIQKLVPFITDNRNNKVSYYALASYSYMSKYILSANIRGEASNKFGSDKSARFVPIWSVSGRWNVTEESWMEPLMPYLSSLGIRGSFGLQANVTDAHNPEMVISLGSVDTNTSEYMATLLSLPNPGLRWEKTQSYNVGVDFSLFGGRLSGAFDYFHKVSRDQLFYVDVESTNGAKLVTINGGELTNKGWDLNLAAKLIDTKDFNWSLSFNVGKVRNSVDKTAYRSVGYTNYLNGSLIRNGYSVNSFYSYRFGGLDANGYPTYLGTKEKDDEGNVLFGNLEDALASALVYSGQREPDINGGISTYFKYKNLSLNIMFSVSLGAKVRLNDLYDDGDNFKLPYPHQNMSNDFVDRWRKPGDEANTNIPGLTDKYLALTSSDLNQSPIYGGRMASNYWQMYNDSDIRVVSGNFLRCRSISMSYSFSQSVLNQIHIKGLSASLSVSNPFVIKSKGLMGRDPEQVTMGAGAIPPQQHYALTMSLTF